MVDDLFEVTADRAVVLRVHVQPGAGRTAVVGRHGDALKVRVAAPPEGGRANIACVELLADTLGLRPSQVELAAGSSSRSKRFRLAEVDVDEVRRLLQQALVPGKGGVVRGGGGLRPGR